ncbi:M48 family metallopeptidase [Acidovorax sp. SUPP3334]|uniref:M48 family metallopeptidase n=1 Tax=Acidovorax sp. SUPP3334 TaxID=2920881 RepID=UPI0023DE41E7|nr:M48 family metallopeptidase [Acidovorax sp. SUPP3334]GKT25354.1 M48 family metallopeptidase [Acidovorax sp. SUPP3334]
MADLSAPRAAALAADASALVPARWYDGLSSKGQPALVGLAPGARGPTLTLHPLGPGGAAPRVFGFRDVDWPEAWSADRPPPRVVVDLRDHGSLEIEAVDAWQAAMRSAGHRPGIAQRMQTRWTVLAAMVLASVLALVLFYRYGTPWAATQLTRHVPIGWETALSDNAMRQMDERTLKPSQLPAARQAQLRERFDALAMQSRAMPPRYGGYAPRLQLDFRQGMGANAFALPGGRVVMTDGLALAAARNGMSDDALIGVLAHEIGHVVHRHTTRTVVEQGVLNIGLGLALGDVSGLLSTGGALLTGLAYSRDHEREADCYAIALMDQARLPTAPMADLLLAIARDQEKSDADTKAKASGQGPQKNGGQGAGDSTAPRPDLKHGGEGLMSLLNSHPGTVQRATELREGRAPHCAR